MLVLSKNRQAYLSITLLWILLLCVVGVNTLGATNHVKQEPTVKQEQLVGREQPSVTMQPTVTEQPVTAEQPSDLETKAEPEISADAAQPAVPEQPAAQELSTTQGMPVGQGQSAAKAPASALLQSFPTVKQMPNYCGPAALSSVMQFWGEDTDQKKVAKSVYDWRIQATNGADMLLYARDKGYSAYSWNSSLSDLKKKLDAGLPVIVLQDISLYDKSGHFRVAIGYDDAKQVIRVMDPYEVEKDAIPYSTFNKLWDSHGNWGLIVIPDSKDTLKHELGEKNPVVHIDLAYVYYRKGKLTEAADEGRKALALEPRNPDALSLVNKVKRDLQYAAGSKAKTNEDKK